MISAWSSLHSAGSRLVHLLVRRLGASNAPVSPEFANKAVAAIHEQCLGCTYTH